MLSNAAQLLASFTHSLIRTYSTAVWSSRYEVVLKLQIWVEDVRVELHSAVEMIANPIPVRGGLGHGGMIFFFIAGALRYGIEAFALGQ